MFYRALALGIVAFWLWMTLLLVRVELFPGKAGLLPVPVDYVWRLIFLHEQSSDLVLYSHRQRLGTLHIQPRRLPARADGIGPIQALTAIGGFALDLPGLPPGQRVVLHAMLELDEREQMQRVETTASFHEPGQKTPGHSILIDGRPPAGQWHYQVRYGDEILKENTGTSAIFLDALNLPSLGIDPQSVARMEQQQAGATTITARHGILRVNGEDVETYVVTIHQADSLESTIHLNQLGQILAVKTFTGYDLYDESIPP